MFSPSPQVKIWLYSTPVDMRKSFNGLMALVKQQLGRDPMVGYFVFVGRRQSLMKVLYFEAGGFCIWTKRLEQGRFQLRRFSEEAVNLSRTDFQLLLEGLEVEKIRCFKRYQHDESRVAVA
jgi:transposase